MNKIIGKAGCKPPHLNSIMNVPMCSNESSLAFFWEPSIAQVELFKPPCKSIDQIDFSYEEIGKPYLLARPDL